MADAWGIDDGYHDVHGQWHDTSDPTRRALRVAQGGLADLADPPPQARPVWFVRHGSGPPIQRPAELDLEDGTVLHARDALPPDLPLGYHDLHPDDGGPTTRLIVVPDRCHLPEGLRTWAWTVQLYAARS
ncbi:MAG: 4-alpha-glucanotransferase, partial [Acidimicrobiaceae bacterium]